MLETDGMKISAENPVRRVVIKREKIPRPAFDLRGYLKYHWLAHDITYPSRNAGCSLFGG